MKTKADWFPFWCQCKDCLETFDIEAMVSGGKIIRLDDHPRIVRDNNGTYYHRCGGNGHMKGRLVLYPVLKRNQGR